MAKYTIVLKPGAYEDYVKMGGNLEAIVDEHNLRIINTDDDGEVFYLIEMLFLKKKRTPIVGLYDLIDTYRDTVGNLVERH